MNFMTDKNLKITQNYISFDVRPDEGDLVITMHVMGYENLWISYGPKQIETLIETLQKRYDELVRNMPDQQEPQKSV